MEIVFVTPRFPYPPLKGDQVRSFNQIREISKSNNVFLISQSSRFVDQEEIDMMEKYCEEVHVVNTSTVRNLISSFYSFFFRGRTVNESYFRSSALDRTVERFVRRIAPDLLHFCMIRTARAGFNLTNQTRSVDFVDALSLSLKRKTERRSWWNRWFWETEKRRVERLEAEILRRFDFYFVTSETDRRVLCERESSCQIAVIPNGVDLDRFSHGEFEKRARRRIVFTGNMSYAPNVEAVCHFADEIFPGVRRSFPDAHFQIIGAEPSQSVSRLAQRDGIEVCGFVESIAQHLRGATLSVCPLQSGAGIQNKVLEAMATGTPVVASPIAIEGIEGAEEADCAAVGEGPVEFGNQVKLLLEDAELRKGMGERARRFIEENYTWETQVNTMLEQLEVEE